MFNFESFQGGRIEIGGGIYQSVGGNGWWMMVEVFKGRQLPPLPPLNGTLFTVNWILMLGTETDTKL